MTDRHPFETRLEVRLRARAALATRPFDAAAIARQAVAVSSRRRRIGRIDWPSRSTALAWLVMALLLAIALLGALAAIGALLQAPDPVPVARMAIIRQQVGAINARDTDAFIDSFIPEGVFSPGGDFAGSSSLFANSLPLADTSLVDTWMAINDAWGFEAEIVVCQQDRDVAIEYGYGEGRGDPMVVNCEVAARWHSLSVEITQRWSYEFHGSGLGHRGFGLLDLNPRERALPLGYDGLLAWEAWLEGTDPDAAARYLNPRDAPACDGCDPVRDALAPGDPEGATRLGPLLSSARNDWSVNGHRFWPRGLIPYDPAFADEIEASVQQFLDSSLSDYLEPRS